MTIKYSPIANLHTPDELLENAEILLMSKNPKMFRGAILEAITALEAYIQETVFTNLETKLDPPLVQWLKEKTKMDFDARLSVLTPIATGIPIDKKAVLWQDYKKSKDIRNKVTHSGKKVSEIEAKYVIDTVYKWLSYLGKTVGLELELVKFKKYVENNNITVDTEEKSSELISDYFGRSSAGKAAKNIIINESGGRYIVDATLQFGDEIAIVEVKMTRNFSTDFIEQAKNQVRQLTFAYMSSNQEKVINKKIHSVVICFVASGIPEEYDFVHTIGEDLHVVLIKSSNS